MHEGLILTSAPDLLDCQRRKDIEHRDWTTSTARILLSLNARPLALLGCCREAIAEGHAFAYVFHVFEQVLELLLIQRFPLE